MHLTATQTAIVKVNDDLRKSLEVPILGMVPEAGLEPARAKLTRF